MNTIDGVTVDYSQWSFAFFPSQNITEEIKAELVSHSGMFNPALTYCGNRRPGFVFKKSDSTAAAYMGYSLPQKEEQKRDSVDCTGFTLVDYSDKIFAIFPQPGFMVHELKALVGRPGIFENANLTNPQGKRAPAYSFLKTNEQAMRILDELKAGTFKGAPSQSNQAYSQNKNERRVLCENELYTVVDYTDRSYAFFAPPEFVSTFDHATYNEKLSYNGVTRPGWVISKRNQANVNIINDLMGIELATLASASASANSPSNGLPSPPPPKPKMPVDLVVSLIEMLDKPPSKLQVINVPSLNQDQRRLAYIGSNQDVIAKYTQYNNNPEFMIEADLTIKEYRIIVITYLLD